MLWRTRRYSAKEPYKRDDILQKSPIKETTFIHRQRLINAVARLLNSKVKLYKQRFPKFSVRYMSRIHMSHVSLTNESFGTYKWVMMPIQSWHVAHTNESWHTYKWVTSHMQMSHVAYTNESYRLYKWDMSHLQISHVPRMDESYRT